MNTGSLNNNNNRLRPPVINRASQGGSLAPPVPVGQMSNNSTRRKVVLKPGHSALHWETTKKGSNFRGDLPPYPIRVPKEELQKHNTMEDYWIAIKGKVYNLTPYLDFHPGGVEVMKKCAGKDGTSLFNKYHPWVNVEQMLDACFIGFLI